MPSAHDAGAVLYNELSSKIEEGLQAHCKNQPSVHGQLAGVSKLNPRKTRDPFYKSEVRSDPRQCGACRIRRQALLLAREGIKTRLGGGRNCTKDTREMTLPELDRDDQHTCFIDQI
jgi:hypothetical protein